jgi:hypothetical protein
MSEPTQGLIVSRDDGQSALSDAAIMAMNYRGDVTLHPTVGDPVACFVFDSTHELLRYMTSDGKKGACAVDDLHSIAFSGKDTAAGISFDKWVKRYVERTLDGLDASLDSEDLSGS